MPLEHIEEYIFNCIRRGRSAAKSWEEVNKFLARADKHSCYRVFQKLDDGEIINHDQLFALERVKTAIVKVMNEMHPSLGDKAKNTYFDQDMILSDDLKLMWCAVNAFDTYEGTWKLLKDRYAAMQIPVAIFGEHRS